jgi:hypothetical protein
MQDVVVTSPVAVVLLFNMVNEYEKIGRIKPWPCEGKVRKKLFQVLISISWVSAIDCLDQRRYFEDARIIGECLLYANFSLVYISTRPHLF